MITDVQTTLRKAGNYDKTGPTENMRSASFFAPCLQLYSIQCMYINVFHHISATLTTRVVRVFLIEANLSILKNKTHENVF